MIQKLIITAILFQFFIPASIAQEESEESKGTDRKSKFTDKFFMAITTSTYMDYIVSPLKFYTSPTGNTDPAGNPTYASVPYQTSELNILSMGLEPRYNIKEFDENSSLSVSAPVAFGIGSSFSAAGDNLVVRGVDGFGSVQIPLLLKLNLGNGSTYKTQKDFGFSFGTGLEMSKIGLINLSEASKKYNKAFVLPCFSAGITFMRANSPMEINFKYAFGSVTQQSTDPQGALLKDGAGVPYIRNAKAQTLKLTFVYLMNY